MREVFPSQLRLRLKKVSQRWTKSRHEKSYRLIRKFRRGEILTPELLPACAILVDKLLPRPKSGDFPGVILGNT
jgi:hypothetical protein